ncbi:GTP-binding protein [Synechococcus sp. M16CYN]|uniref:GTP-binding protein n=1 Tax=Synechococcus sp. M16CYN TaxID=3103139 RepID=UPI003254E61C
MAKRLPVTIITGFLGAGKTTVIRRLLVNGGRRLAVVINEFGSIGLDGALIRSCGFCSEEEVENRLVELNNGCLCCTVQDDFLPTMKKLLKRSDQLDGIVIETSGLALPRPLLQALDWPEIRSEVHINGVVTLVDGEALAAGSPVADPEALERQRLEDPSLDHINAIDELFKNQLQAADLVLISRADTLSVSQLDEVKVSLLPGVRDGTALLAVANGSLDATVILGLEHQTPVHAQDDHEHHHSHVAVIESNVRLEGDLDRSVLEALLPKLVRDHQVIRLKGRVWLTGKALPLQLQMVGPRLNSWFEAAPHSLWQPVSGAGVDLVVLALTDSAAFAIESGLQRLLNATPKTTKTAAATPRH